MFKYFSDDNPYCDPPDVFDLFQFYNTYFFENTLEACQLKWSKRMTLCAGTCKYEGQNSCILTLSEPLLKFRSNDELKSTLLHEMIHAYLFINKPTEANINEGHGPAFLEKMHHINHITGLQLSVYHQFHDEVERCRNHVWRCNGKCQAKPPFFGFVKRAINRPPGKTDYWFEKHKQECGGTFEKISEPEKKPQQKQITKKKSPKVEVTKQITLSSFFTQEQLETQFVFTSKNFRIHFTLILNSQLNFDLFKKKLETILSYFIKMFKVEIEFEIKKLLTLKQSLEKCKQVKIIKVNKEGDEQLKLTHVQVQCNQEIPDVCMLLQLNNQLL